MSRITKDQNQWGAGDLNGTPSSVKTNEGDHVKRYGPLGLGGVGGVTNNNGLTHDVVYELTGKEIQEEDGVINAAAYLIKIPRVAEIVSMRAIINQPFDTGSVVTVDLDGVAVNTAPQAVDVVGTFSVAINESKTAENTGDLTVDLSGLVANLGVAYRGNAEIVVTYEKV